MAYEVTSNNTKRMMALALRAAMQEKEFSKITVSEIVSCCGINRKTFYYHFEDLNALLKWLFEQEAVNVVKQFDLIENYESAIRFIMQYVEQNATIIRSAYTSLGHDEIKRLFFADFHRIILDAITQAEHTRAIHLDTGFKEYLAEFYTTALTEVLVSHGISGLARNKEKELSYLTSIINMLLESLQALPQNNK